MSTDHHWGPHVMVFLTREDHRRVSGDLWNLLADKLPFTFRGYPTNFEESPDEPGVTHLKATDTRPINHRVQTLVGEPSVMDWLTIPEQKLRTLAKGGVFHDGLDLLEPMQRKLAYYPREVWLYLLSAQWKRIGQEEPFVGRAGMVGDEIGSEVIGTRLVRDLMRLCLLFHEEYAPYPKWFGTAFSRLDCAPRLGPVFERVLKSKTWEERQGHLASAYEMVAGMYNGLGITVPVPEKVSLFHGRPFYVIGGEEIARIIWDAIQDEEVKALPYGVGKVKALPYGVGKIDQYVDSTDVLSHTERCRRLSAIYA
jgi:hypothetical protein